MRGSRTVSAAAVLALLGAMFIHGPAAAQTPDDKFRRGLVNFFTGVIEIPATIKEESTASNPVQGLTVGVVKGVYRAGKRELVGIYEILTFPMAGSSGYGPVMEPERAWDRFE